MAIDKVFYNKSSADSLGWSPEWFGVKYHDEKLVSAIRKWQRAHGLTADGLCGPLTYRRAIAVKEAESDDTDPIVSFDGSPKSWLAYAAGKLSYKVAA